MSVAAWAAVGIGAAGIGTSLYGANKQSKDTAHAQDLNLAAQKESERQNWLHFLMQRGINPDPNTPNGVVPGVPTGGAMNTRLPLWANIDPASVPGLQTNASRGVDTPFLIRK